MVYQIISNAESSHCAVFNCAENAIDYLKIIEREFVRMEIIDNEYKSKPVMFRANKPVDAIMLLDCVDTGYEYDNKVNIL